MNVIFSAPSIELLRTALGAIFGVQTIQRDFHYIVGESLHQRRIYKISRRSPHISLLTAYQDLLGLRRVEKTLLNSIAIVVTFARKLISFEPHTLSNIKSLILTKRQWVLTRKNHKNTYTYYKELLCWQVIKHIHVCGPAKRWQSSERIIVGWSNSVKSPRR